MTRPILTWIPTHKDPISIARKTPGTKFSNNALISRLGVGKVTCICHIDAGFRETWNLSVIISYKGRALQDTNQTFNALSDAQDFADGFCRKAIGRYCSLIGSLMLK